MTEVLEKHERRTELLDAARHILAEKGLDATKVSDIVALAGVAQGTFYLYFPSKLSLVLALAQEMNEDNMAGVGAAIAGAPSLGDAIDAAVAAAFAAMERYPDVLGIIQGAMIAPEIRAQCRDLFEPYHAFVADLIRQGQADGLIFPEVNAEMSASLIIGLIQHAGQECFIFSAETPSAAFITEVAWFIRRALGVF